MVLLNMRRPQVKHLLAALDSADPEAFIFISDGHEGVSQIRMYNGVVTEKQLDDYTYVRDPVKEAEKIKPGTQYPAIQIDTGC